MLVSSETGEQGQLGNVCVPVSNSLHCYTALCTVPTSFLGITVSPDQGQPIARLYKESIGQDTGKCLGSLTPKGHLRLEQTDPPRFVA